MRNELTEFADQLDWNNAAKADGWAITKSNKWVDIWIKLKFIKEPMISNDSWYYKGKHKAEEVGLVLELMKWII